MRAIDTNVLVRLLVRDDARQTARAEEFVSEGAWVSHMVLIETAWVLSSVYGLGHRELATAMEMLLNHETLRLEDPATVAAALGHYRAHKAVEFSDCMILETARTAGHGPLGTFDKPLGAVQGAQGI